MPENSAFIARKTNGAVPPGYSVRSQQTIVESVKKSTVIDDSKQFQLRYEYDRSPSTPKQQSFVEVQNNFGHLTDRTSESLKYGDEFQQFMYEQVMNWKVK